MNTSTAIALAVGVVVILAALAFIALARKSDVRGAGELSGETKQRDRSGGNRQQRKAAAEVEAQAAQGRSSTAVQLAGTDGAVDSVSGTGLVPFVPPDRDAIDTSRRHFFNIAILSLMGVALGEFASASFVAYLWPSSTGGFGGKIKVGRLDDIKSGIVTGSGFFYASEAKSWITEYPSEAIPKAEENYPEAMLAGMRQGIIVSYQKCPHLGCRVPQCVSSQWFECGCHGSQYNRVGEKKGGPAPRGMDHFAAEITPAGEVIVDTGTIYQGQPIGVNTTGQEAEGPHCVGAAEH